MSKEEAAGKTFISRVSKIRLLIDGGSYHAIFDPKISEIINLLATRIEQDEARSRVPRSGVYPERVVPDDVELRDMLRRKWESQHGNCGLCQSKIDIGTKNKLLAASTARVDADIKTYSVDNTMITHMGCKYAKHTGTLPEWLEYFGMSRL
jgi:hypothetical protein